MKIDPDNETAKPAIIIFLNDCCNGITCGATGFRILSGQTLFFKLQSEISRIQ